MAAEPMPAYAVSGTLEQPSLHPTAPFIHDPETDESFDILLLSHIGPIGPIGPIVFLKLTRAQELFFFICTVNPQRSAHDA